MVKKKKEEPKEEEEPEEEKDEGGMSLDDAFGDDEDVEYAESKPKKLKVKKVEEKPVAVSNSDEEIQIKSSKPVAKLKKGDKVKIDGKELEVDAHYILIDHGSTKEMAIELFDPKADKDYQLRYFSDQVERSLEFYELQEIMYVKKGCKKVEW